MLVYNRCAYDLHGNVVAEFGTGAQPIVFGFDDANNPVSQKLFRVAGEVIEDDPRSREDLAADETRWIYHAATGLLLSKIYPDEGQLDYAYDVFNRLASTTWTREVSAGTRLKATRVYAEKTGELVSVSYNDGTPGETHVYNHLGQLTQSADASGTRVYVYNNYNEFESETLTGDAIAHAVTELRDAFGRGTGYVYAKNGSVQQTTGTAYAEATGRLATACFVHGGAEKTFTYNYPPSLGRFLSRDPIAEQGGFNLYAFVKNTPVLLTDEKGESWSSLAPPGLCAYAATKMPDMTLPCCNGEFYDTETYCCKNIENKEVLIERKKSIVLYQVSLYGRMGIPMLLQHSWLEGDFIPKKSAGLYSDGIHSSDDYEKKYPVWGAGMPTFIPLHPLAGPYQNMKTKKRVSIILDTCKNDLDKFRQCILHGISSASADDYFVGGYCLGRNCTTWASELIVRCKTSTQR